MNKRVTDYLKLLHSESYANPIQTRPRPKPGITKEKPDKELPAGVRGPSGSEVDLDNDKQLGYDFKNFSQVGFDDEENEKTKKRKNSEE